MRSRVLVFASLAVGWVGCAASEPATRPEPAKALDVAAADQLTVALSKLPTCGAAVEVGTLSVEATVCSKMACASACCNRCGWVARFTSASGVRSSVDPARARALVGLGDGGFDCEIAAWQRVLAQHRLSLDGAGCVGRQR